MRGVRQHKDGLFPDGMITVSLDTVQKFGANAAIVEKMVEKGIGDRITGELTGIGRTTYYYYKRELREYEKNSDQRQGVSN